MASDDKNQPSGQKQNPSSGQSQGEPTRRSPTNPFGQPESDGNEPIRRAPGSEQEYQGKQPPEKRAPGVEQDDSVDGGSRKPG